MREFPVTQQLPKKLITPVFTINGIQLLGVGIALLFISFHLWILFTKEGTFDDGDSIHHFLYAKYAFSYPHFFIHQWAKPVYVLFASSFSQFGFMGIKVLHLILAYVTAFFVYDIARLLGLRWAFVAPLILLSMPGYVKIIFSGLTEPIFAFVVTAGILLCLRHRFFWASVVFSMAPFARPEGLFFMAICAGFLISNRQWKYVPMLLLGHVIISIVGRYIFDHSSLFWLFAENPNAVIKPSYNQTGEWLHYFYGLHEYMGTPLFYLLLIGICATIYKAIYKNKRLGFLLILLSFLSVIGAHTIFWKYGLFKSFGLLRVIACVLPFAAIICLIGISSLMSLLYRMHTRVLFPVISTILFLILIYPFLGKKYSFQLDQDFSENANLLMSKKVAQYLQEHFPKSMYYSFAPAIPYYKNDDPFNWRVRQGLNTKIKNYTIPCNAMVVWDDWYAKVEGKVPLTLLEEHPNLIHHKTFSTISEYGKERKIILFQEAR